MILLGFLLALAVSASIVLGVQWILERVAAKKAAAHAEAERAELAKCRQRIAYLEKWAIVADADSEAKRILTQAAAQANEANQRSREIIEQAETDAKIFIQSAQWESERTLAAAKAEAKQHTATARERAQQVTAKADASLAAAAERAAQILADAETKAEQIAGKAYDAVRNADRYEQVARAMKNIIDGYGDAYLKPAESLLDDLAEEFSHKEAGQKLKLARDRTKLLIQSRHAARCDYAESSRREGAERFVLDAFNGKVDSILSRVRHDNFGKLEQEIIDAFAIVNMGGRPFRNARITEEYLGSRMDELEWAVVAHELRKQEQEEQRRIREQIREEEKAKRDYERAMREAAQQEKILRKAMAEAQAKIAAATEEQRAQYEAQLAELNARLNEAEEKNQRAISMAQQTRRGHVYVISNIGSFGEHVYKIGLTRRLEPLDRVKELGDASVPFDFDVHAIILSDDAPALETRLHKHFLMNQLNKVNHRKEFFRADLAEIRREIEELGIEAHWTMAAEAREYRESLAIERMIENDPDARSQWVNRQLTLDPVEYTELISATDSSEAL